ncbi:MAG TPA: hypothetical protein VF265_02820 [Nevskiaceae bacterium]
MDDRRTGPLATRIGRRAAGAADLSFPGRGAAALVSLPLATPVCGLLWFAFNASANRWLRGDAALPPWVPGFALLGFAALCFVFPRVAPATVKRMWALVLWLGRRGVGQ